MLALLTAKGTRLDAGTVALAVARRWSESGERVLFVDADASGSRLAQRLSDAALATYSPAERGMPSLIAAREPLTLRLLASHCYNLDVEGGSLWALFGPHHPDGASYAAGWLAERVEHLVAVDAQRRLVVALTLDAAAGQSGPLAGAASVAAVLARVATVDDARALLARSRDAGMRRHDSSQQTLIIDGHSPLDDDEIFLESGMRVAGRLPVIDDDRILRLQGGRRERSFVKSLDGIAARLLALSNLVGSPDVDTGAKTESSIADRSGFRPAVNGTADDPLPGASPVDAVRGSEWV